MGDDDPCHRIGNLAPPLSVWGGEAAMGDDGIRYRVRPPRHTPERPTLSPVPPIATPATTFPPRGRGEGRVVTVIRTGSKGSGDDGLRHNHAGKQAGGHAGWGYLNQTQRDVLVPRGSL